MKTKNLAVSILVGVLVVALWYMELLKPTRAKVASVKSDTTAQEQKLAPLQRQLSQAQHDAAHAAEFKAQLQSLQLALPNSPALAAFLRDANGIASAAGVTWQSVSHSAPVPGLGGVQSITVGLQVQGTYGQIVDYLSRLASMKRLLVVDSLQLSTSTSGAPGSNSGTSSASTGPFSGGDQLTATISSRMFATPDAATAAASGTTGTSTASAGTSTAPASSTGSTSSSG
jgi:Tfp pilus assembly protein PilO